MSRDRHGWYNCTMSFQRGTDALYWCHEQFESDYWSIRVSSPNIIFKFRRKDNAVWFLLRWSE